MKKLQNDNTTLEQSKRLLELGVPADSANYYYGKDGKIHYIDGIIPRSLLWADGLVPCWSVGRLIEIYMICTLITPNVYTCINDKLSIIDNIIIDYENMYSHGKLDFSKLED